MERNITVCPLSGLVMLRIRQVESSKNMPCADNAPGGKFQVNHLVVIEIKLASKTFNHIILCYKGVIIPRLCPDRIGKCNQQYLDIVASEYLEK